MNNFANSLLHLLLSWMRMLFSDFLSFFQEGSSGLISWISKRWTLLALILIAAGLTVDLLIYLLRWRPQKVWQTKLRRLFHRSRYDDFDEKQFNAGFTDALPNYDFGDTPIPDLTQRVSEANPIYDSDLDYPAAPAVNGEGAFSDPDLLQPERKRRSDRHGGGRRSLFPDLPGSQKNAKKESAVSTRSAFYEPVYSLTDNQYDDADNGNYRNE